MKEYIAPIIIVVLLIIMSFFYYKWDSSVKDHEAYVQGINEEKIRSSINKPSEEVNKRENDLYPKINSNIIQINKDVKTLNETVKRLEKNQQTKEQYDEKFKNKNINEINEFLTSNGFSGTIISK